MKKIVLSILFAACSLLAYGQADSVSLGYGISVSKSESTVSADAVTQAQLLYTDSNNSLNSLYGLIPGLQVSQGGSLPWEDTPGLKIRGNGSFSGNSVLVIVDGIERDAALISPNEIETITVLRDAAATALYGNRAADGVVVITTKRGLSHKTAVKANYTFGTVTPFRIPKMVGAYDYALAVNEALSNDGLEPKFSQNDLMAISDGNADYLPDNDWKDMVLKSNGFTNDLNISFDGANDALKYFVYVDFDSYSGIFKDTEINDGYSTQAKSTALKARANIDSRLTKTTFVRFNLMGRLNQYQQPNGGCGLSSMYNTPALSFPVQHDNHYVRTSKFSNPYEDKVGIGYATALNRSLYADVAIDQDLHFITPGLKALVLFGYDNNATIHDNRPYNDIYYQMDYTRSTAGDITGAEYTAFGDNSGNGFGVYLGSQYMTFTNYEKVSYTGDFGQHHIDAAAIFSLMQQRFTGANNVYLYQDNILNANYGYAGKYFVSATLNYSGSAKLASGDKYRLYPAVSAAWIVSNESFLNGSAFDFLKLRASYGIVGCDRYMSYDMDQQSNGGGGGYIFNNRDSIGGLQEGGLPSPVLDPEKDHKANIGIEGTLGGKFSFQLEGFYNHRTCMRVTSSGAFSDALGIGVSDNCTGEASNLGGELMLSWKDKVGEFSYHIDANVGFTRSKVIYWAEAYHPYDWMYYTGMPISSYYGLTSDGYYQASDFESDGTLKAGVPVSTFIDVKPGDIKYVDRNEDGKIDAYDYSYTDSSTPIIYGLQLGATWKNFGLEMMFNGVYGGNVAITTAGIYQPLYNNDKNISEYALENRWTPENTNARFPRLTTLSNNNNYASSDVWRSSWNFFKLRNVMLWYDFKDFRFFIRGNNLFSVDSIGLFDPEAIGTNYPAMRNFQAGIKYSF